MIRTVLARSLPHATRAVAATTVPRALAAAALAASPVPWTAAPARGYAKKTDNKKGASGKKGGKNDAAANDEGAEAVDLDVVFDVTKMKDQLDQQIAKMRAAWEHFNLGKASPTMLDKVVVAHKKAHVPLPQVAQVSLKDAHTLLVIVPDENFTKAVETAIRSSGLNLNPMPDTKNSLKVPVPKPTAELRQSLAKQVHKVAEDTKTKVRTVRQHEISRIKAFKGAGVSSDDKHALQQKFEKAVHTAIEQIDALAKNKTKEVLGQ
ncbi:ribosome recycling factor [Allomyces macrogynus ATCC 38327]|uniref:Ribosome recycling factor n=1 Tax=Allomyces macrogynus (strain ATCC 38327) TaxID=578462 RepID=A0A0L0S5R2_ALLM3|nr:ribosome recycling factor [Allomyces macrogynus ATCC 38327]|eukprot:KNE57704.1 ribosome recycling factor [Allomyces macrogynus ATCC 38327]